MDASSPRVACRGRRDSAGFSLVELLMMVSIAVVLMSMGVTQVLAGVRQYRVQQAASEVAGRLMDARLNALKRNRPVWLAFDLETQTYRVQTNDPDGNPMDLSPATALPQGINITAAPAQIDYDALGRLAAAQTVTLSDGATARQVTVSVTGTTSVSAVD